MISIKKWAEIEAAVKRHIHNEMVQHIVLEDLKLVLDYSPEKAKAHSQRVTTYQNKAKDPGYIAKSRGRPKKQDV
jgi:hypothetical protein